MEYAEAVVSADLPANQAVYFAQEKYNSTRS
jgi:hypothetical protein